MGQLDSVGATCSSLPEYNRPRDIRDDLNSLRTSAVTKYTIQGTNIQFGVPPGKDVWFGEYGNELASNLQKNVGEAMSFYDTFFQGKAFKVRLKSFLSRTGCHHDVDMVVSYMQDALQRKLYFEILSENTRAIARYYPHLSNNERIYLGVKSRNGEVPHTSIVIHELAHAIDHNDTLSRYYATFIQDTAYMGDQGYNEIPTEVYARIMQTRHALMEHGYDVFNKTVTVRDIKNILYGSLNSDSEKMVANEVLVLSNSAGRWEDIPRDIERLKGTTELDDAIENLSTLLNTLP